MKYHAYLYDKLDPAEIAEAPPEFDLNDPLLADRLALERAIGDPDALARAARYRAQADLASAIYSTLSLTNPIEERGAGVSTIELSIGAMAIRFDRLSETPAEAGDPWSGVASPELSRRLLIDLNPHDLAQVMVSLWRDRAAWTRKVHGHALTPPRGEHG